LSTEGFVKISTTKTTTKIKKSFNKIKSYLIIKNKLGLNENYL